MFAVQVVEVLVIHPHSLCDLFESEAVAEVVIYINHCTASYSRLNVTHKGRNHINLLFHYGNIVVHYIRTRNREPLSSTLIRMCDA